jgi:hypothetical protein
MFDMKPKPFKSKEYIVEFKKYGNLISQLRNVLSSYRNSSSLWENNDLLNQTKRCQKELDSLMGMISSIEKKESARLRKEKNANL